MLRTAGFDCPVTLASLLTLALLVAPVATAAPTLEEETEAWHQQRVASLTGDDGWLTLVGLHWFTPGANAFGSDPRNRIILPKSAPARVGIFTLTDKTVHVAAAPGTGVTTIEEQEDGSEKVGPPVTTLTLTSDADGDPTVLALGSLRFYVIDREGRLGLRIKDRQSPARQGFEGIDRFPVQPSWQVEAKLEPYDPPKEIEIPNVLGGVYKQSSPGALVFDIDGESYRLEPTVSGDELFVVFGDKTNGKESYGAGRFLDAPMPDADGRVVLDFNRAYNPPCAFTPYATCPLPPPQNKLSVRIEAGEKKYAAAH